MEKKLKGIILALVVLLAISFFIIFSIQGSKLALLREYNTTKERLTKENEEFSKKLKSALAESKDLQDRLVSIQGELERISREKTELQRKYELVDKEKKDLLEKLKKRMPQKPTAALPTPMTEDAYWAEILKTKVDLEFQVKNLTQKLNNLQMSNQQLQNEKISSELKITGLNQEKQELERKLQYNERLLNSVSTEMVHEKNKIHQLQKDLATIKEENKALRREVKRLDKQRLAFAEKLTNLLEEKERLAARIEEAELMLSQKVSMIEQMHHEFEALLKKAKTEEASGTKPTKESVELPKIIVSSSPVTEVEKPIRLEGKILTVNREHNFVVIDLGRGHGVSEGMVFEVFREGELLGKLKAIQLREDITACDIIDIIQIDTPFKIGDIARPRL